MEIGDHVRCADGSFHPAIAKLYTALPIKDRYYVVRDVRLGVEPNGDGAVSILLVGLNNPKANSKAALERGFDSRRFVTKEQIRQFWETFDAAFYKAMAK